MVTWAVNVGVVSIKCHENGVCGKRSRLTGPTLWNMTRYTLIRCYWASPASASVWDQVDFLCWVFRVTRGRKPLETHCRPDSDRQRMKRWIAAFPKSETPSFVRKFGFLHLPEVPGLPVCKIFESPSPIYPFSRGRQFLVDDKNFRTYMHHASNRRSNLFTGCHATSESE
ncbi:hypothetical protein M378DRAFT_218684 [Amanita muscaria Koide BX008]|uniref:Uncharacterized protein n=1 Tax=Amanita muscaria (strain Koide BX008) TaxID=946122 RepID=A0A0C2XP86_AMAMK|nr:hypothetical protein M378DRAFT_218684 [Amanita muscaria Koide BX008]